MGEHIAEDILDDFRRQHAAVGDKAGVVRIVNLESKQLVETIPSRETSKVTHVDLSSDAKTLTYHAEGVAHMVHLKLK